MVIRHDATMTEDQRIAVAVAVGLLNDHFEDVQVVYRKGSLKEILVDSQEEEEDDRWAMKPDNHLSAS